MALLEVNKLSVSFVEADGVLRNRVVPVMEDVDLSVDAGEIVAVIGASGSGKSLLAHAIMGILPEHARRAGEIRYRGELLDERKLGALRGRELAFIPQSVSYLDPLMRVDRQVRGSVRSSDRTVRQRTLFERYELNNEVEGYYPYQLSGGMARKVLLSAAVIGGARLLIADEPTPGMHPLDVEEALRQLRELAQEGCGVLFITHDIEAALTIADRVAVIYAGTTVEIAPVQDFAGDGSRLRHPYSRALWRAMPANGFEPLPGAQPRPYDGVRGCLFANRCGDATDACVHSRPAATELRSGIVRCVHAT